MWLLGKDNCIKIKLNTKLSIPLKRAIFFLTQVIFFRFNCTMFIYFLMSSGIKLITRNSVTEISLGKKKSHQHKQKLSQ